MDPVGARAVSPRYSSTHLALEHEGTAWPKLQNYVPTRSGSQIRSHAQKYFDKLANKFESKEILGDQF